MGRPLHSQQTGERRGWDVGKLLAPSQPELSSQGACGRHCHPQPSSDVICQGDGFTRQSPQLSRPVFSRITNAGFSTKALFNRLRYRCSPASSRNLGSRLLPPLSEHPCLKSLVCRLLQGAAYSAGAQGSFLSCPWPRHPRETRDQLVLADTHPDIPFNYSYLQQQHIFSPSKSFSTRVSKGCTIQRENFLQNGSTRS